ncbi:SRPBCC family protein [Erythrobacter sp. HL-111]|uniref:aromatic ring-hydroxylating oxygenase subunit alpha n=1 Tax=Erythrobacter sp. HL-111 TaxID=1798193 RepID=UPI0006DB852D|nr:aromatic ring-hydroxylating dioxygenase subunit alpha [Erythrobacter sp. HL-111]KPP95003.1 MAG: dioxygenase catalytic subunit [Erythrobacteraceae bacterium HL-111]SDS12395.1 Rieske [2Fe-2S] domain-containing protein [Erythrobacter sp. HL-111]
MPQRSPRAPRPTLSQMLAREKRPVPPLLAERGEASVPVKPIDRRRYYDPDFAALENARLWPRTWQMACRLEDIPEVGDYVLYEIAEISLIVVRSDRDTVKAFFNACLHRGRALRDADGTASEFRCPFHGFTWGLDGACKRIVNEWDFAHVDKADFALPEAQVGIWGGFVFVCPDGCEQSLEHFLGPVVEAYETRGWSLAERTKAVHVQKINRCNWKIALEAFIESFHVTETHASAAPYLGDANTQYDVWEGTAHTRMISPRGLASPNVGPLSDEEVYRAGMRPALGDAADALTLPDTAESAREAIAAARRKALVGQGVEIAAEATDCELIDTIQYHVFPNLVCWAGWGSYLVYRFRPLGTDPDMSVMDIMFVVPGGDPGAVPEPQVVGPDASLQEAPQLGGYCAVFDEDSANLAALQRGLRTMRKTGPVTGAYQEARIRHFHAMLDKSLGQG